MTISNVLKIRYQSWNELEKQIESLSTTTERGEVFEQFVFAFLKIKSDLYQIKEVYRSKEIPIEIREKYSIEAKDSGIDGIFILSDGKCCAYQVKFRTGRSIPSYAELSKFWVEAKHTDYNYTIANCYYVTKLASKNDKHLSILVEELDKLDPIFFNNLYEFVNNSKVKKILAKPERFQEKMVSDCVTGLKKADRGKLLAACGTGKTLTSLWISQGIDAKSVLFLAPSLALIKQTLESWANNTENPFKYICVCSDRSVSENIDEGDIEIGDFNYPVTTNSQEIVNFLSNTNRGQSIVFATYQSLKVISDSLNVMPNYSFDLTIFDEAHRTAGSKTSQLFSLALHDEFVKSKKRLFMTATERLIKPWILKKAAEYDRVVFSMDDELVYGKVLHQFNFGDAIKQGVISDYRIVVAGVKESEARELISSNNWIVNKSSDATERFSSSQNIFRQILLLKSMQEFPIKKVITFHSTVKSAKEFIDGLNSTEIDIKTVYKTLWPELKKEDLYFDHISGEMSSGLRKQKLDLFSSKQYGIISNARCLTEGVDVPAIDSVYFVNPKSSLIDIIQACGRALRIPRTELGKTNKIAYFIVPIIIPEGNQSEVINKLDFEMLYSIIQSLRDQDQRLTEWVDELNLAATKGRVSTFNKGMVSPVEFKLPKEFDVDKFKENVYLKIAEVNGDPNTYSYKTKQYGRKERKSNFKRIFKTLGDYSIESYKNNLVDPTISKFNKLDSVMKSSDLIINNNNISHTQRLGLISKRNKDFSLTPMGQKYKIGEIEFKDLFRQQMLKYFSTEDGSSIKRILFPYRSCLKILLNTKRVSYIEFVFNLYTLVDSSQKSILDAIEGINYLRTNYPNIEITNTANRESLLNELNEYFGTNYSETDIWEKKTTVNNQFIYFRNHLSMFDECVEVNQNSISLIATKEGVLRQLLDENESLEKELNTDKLVAIYQGGLLIFTIFSLMHR